MNKLKCQLRPAFFVPMLIAALLVGVAAQAAAASGAYPETFCKRGKS
jgi:hypothetical protein